MSHYVYCYRYTGENQWSVGYYDSEEKFQIKIICNSIAEAERQTDYFNGRWGVGGSRDTATSGESAGGSSGGGAVPIGRHSAIWHTITGCTCSGANGRGECNCKKVRDFTREELQQLSQIIGYAMAWSTMIQSDECNKFMKIHGKILNMIEDYPHGN